MAAGPDASFFTVQSAGSELSAAIGGHAAKQKPGRYYDANATVQFRQQVLTVIGEKDAALALDILYRTRPPAVGRTMMPPAQRDKRIRSENNGQYLAENEMSLESNLYRMAAEQDPAKAIPILKAALAEPLSQSTFEQLTRLAGKSLDAKEAGTSVIKRLVSTNDMQEDSRTRTSISLTNQIIEHYMSNPADRQRSWSELRLDGERRQLPRGQNDRNVPDQQESAALHFGDDAAQICRKAFTRLRQRALKQLNLEQPNSVNPVDTEYTKLMQADTSPEQMLAAAGKLPTGYRSQVYTTASNKLLSQGNSSGPRAVIEENFTDTRASRLSQISTSKMHIG